MSRINYNNPVRMGAAAGISQAASSIMSGLLARRQADQAAERFKMSHDMQKENAERQYGLNAATASFNKHRDLLGLLAGPGSAGGGGGGGASRAGGGAGPSADWREAGDKIPTDTLSKLVAGQPGIGAGAAASHAVRANALTQLLHSPFAGPDAPTIKSLEAEYLATKNPDAAPGEAQMIEDPGDFLRWASNHEQVKDLGEKYAQHVQAQQLASQQAGTTAAQREALVRQIVESHNDHLVGLGLEQYQLRLNLDPTNPVDRSLKAAGVDPEERVGAGQQLAQDMGALGGGDGVALAQELVAPEQQPYQAAREPARAFIDDLQAETNLEPLTPEELVQRAQDYAADLPPAVATAFMEQVIPQLDKLVVEQQREQQAASALNPAGYENLPAAQQDALMRVLTAAGQQTAPAAALNPASSDNLPVSTRDALMRALTATAQPQ